MGLSEGIKGTHRTHIRDSIESLPMNFTCESLQLAMRTSTIPHALIHTLPSNLQMAPCVHS